MKFSEQWLREWIDPPWSTAELAERLTMAGLEVESVGPAAPAFSGVIVGLVKSAAPHPKTDRLRVCRVDTGGSELTVVSGAPDVRAGLRVPLAMVGALLPDGRRMEAADFQGVVSQGMLCSAVDLGLAEQAQGLMALPDNARSGADVRDLLGLGDHILDIAVTPNRGDCLGIAGLAREVGVLSGRRIRWPKMDAVRAISSAELPIHVDEPAACPVYAGRVIEDVDASAPAPLWLTERLRRAGIRSINAVVDVTNYVMLELGQPMHAFDRNRLQGPITVRTALAGERLALLDGSQQELRLGTLVIADARGPLALAGIMGGLDSAVTETTRNVFLESAFFAPQVLAGQARAYGLQTDSSYRFERGVDYHLQRIAIERATRLLLDIVGGRPGPVIEYRSESGLPLRQELVLRKAHLKRLLGTAVPGRRVTRILTQLGMQLRPDAVGWRVRPPSYRFDIAREADLVEEVARIYGYDRLPSMIPPVRIKMRPIEGTALKRDLLCQELVSRGYQEAITYSFVDPALQILLEPDTPPVSLQNPLVADQAAMRISLWPGLIGALRYNLNRQQTRVRLFEMGLVYRKGEKLKQILKIGGLFYGNIFPEQWAVNKISADFYDCKSDVEALLALSLSGSQRAVFKPSRHPALHPGQSADIFIDNQVVGSMGALHPRIGRQLDMENTVWLFELDLAAIIRDFVPKFTQLSRFPSIRRDLSLVVPEELPAEDMLDCIRETMQDSLHKLELFDVYRGEGIDSGKKSLAIGLTFQESSRTLIDSEVNALIEQVLAVARRRFGATLRQ